MSRYVKWTELVNESVHTADDIDIGDIEAINRNFIVVKRGFVNVHHYYIPIGKVEGWDGNVLWIKSTERQVKENYERNVEPNPASYYLKDQSMYNAASFPEVPLLESRHRAHVYPTPSTSTEIPQSYRCDLCEMAFGSEDELSSHVTEKH